jgi:hypothetical protein
MSAGFTCARQEPLIEFTAKDGAAPCGGKILDDGRLVVESQERAGYPVVHDRGDVAVEQRN